VKDGALREAPRVLGDLRRRPAPARCELCRSPVVWASVGAVVVGAVLAIVVTSGGRPPPMVILDGTKYRP